MNTKRILIGTIALSAGLFFQTVNADTLGFRAGTGIWQPDASGTFQHGGGNIDLKNDLYLKDGTDQNYIYAFFEHPIPLIPNIKISQTALSFDGAGTAGGYQFGATTYSTAVTTQMVLDHTDTTIYYSLLDNWFHLDLGLTAKTFDGKLSVTDGTTTETTNIDKTIPLLYAAAGVELPFINNLFFGVEASVLSIGDHTVQDIMAKVSYTTDYWIGFDVGVRTFTMELDKLNGNSSNMEFTGSFANLYIHF